MRCSIKLAEVCYQTVSRLQMKPRSDSAIFMAIVRRQRCANSVATELMMLCHGVKEIFGYVSIEHFPIILLPLFL
jgi:hypothetical protein